MPTDTPMQLGMIGLGRMGSNLVRRLMRDGHRCVAYDVNPGAVKGLEAEGATGAEFFVILDGRARVVRHGRQVATLGPGAFFGDLALLDRAPRNASVIADTPMDLAKLNQRGFDELLELPGFSKKLLAGLARRLREADARTL